MFCVCSSQFKKGGLASGTAVASPFSSLQASRNNSNLMQPRGRSERNVGLLENRGPDFSVKSSSVRDD